MNKCKTCEVELQGKRKICDRCRNDYKNEWQRKKQNRKCAYCGNSYIPNSIGGECSMKCKLLNNIEKNEECWNWLMKIGNAGYGQVTHERKYLLAHRESYKEFKGEIPEGKQVCHSCDNRKCINPAHLWIGSAKENIQDAKAKGRLSKQPMKKFTWIEIKEIRDSLKKGISTVFLSQKFGVSQCTISNIKLNKHYKEAMT